MGPRVNLNEIGVIVKDGVVTLTGWVDSYTKRAGGGAPASFDIGRKRPGTRLSGAGEVRGPTVQNPRDGRGAVEPADAHAASRLRETSSNACRATTDSSVRS
jgi:hypothetical protein